MVLKTDDVDGINLRREGGRKVGGGLYCFLV